MTRLFVSAAVATALLVGASGVSAQEKMDIVDTAVAAGQFKTLAAALTAADLIPVLKGRGPFTVFAPTDEAFAKLPKGTVEALLKDKAKLTAILTYHVVPGVVRAADVVKLDSAKTVQGAKIAIVVKDGKVMVNQATVVKTDIEATNGVIHVIDEVIMPPTTTGQAAPSSAPGTAVAATTPCQGASANAVVVHRQPAMRIGRVRGY